VAKWLTEKNILFECEKTFTGLVGMGNGLLRFDFYTGDVLIEFDGEQHFRNCVDGAWDRLREHDKRKNRYALDNNIPLLRIAYTSIREVAGVLFDFFTKYAHFKFAGNDDFKRVYGVDFQIFTLSDPNLYNKLAIDGAKRDKEMKQDQLSKCSQFSDSAKSSSLPMKLSTIRSKKRKPEAKQKQKSKPQTAIQSNDIDSDDGFGSRPWRLSAAWRDDSESDLEQDEETKPEQAQKRVTSKELDNEFEDDFGSRPWRLSTAWRDESELEEDSES